MAAVVTRKLSIIAPSPESPLLSSYYQPSDLSPDGTQNEQPDRESLKPFLQQVLRPALDGIAGGGGEGASAPKSRVLQLYNRLCDVSTQTAEETASTIQGILKDVCGVEVSVEDARIITTAYDLDSQDMASIEEFILAAKGGLPAIRLHLARDTYNYIANSCNNTTKFLETARKLFHPSGHPRVQSGETDAGRLLQEFRTYWSGYGAKDDENIELIEWEYYFAGVSAGVDSDEWFAKMVQGCWPGMMQVKETERRKTLPALKAQGIQPQVAEKLKLASRIRRLSALVNDPRRFRTGLDVCLIRKPSSAESMYSRPFLRDLVSELYSLVGYSSSSTAEEEQIFEGIYRRVLKEAGIQGKDLLSGTPAGRPRQEGVTGLELYLRTALKRECSFLEYMLFAKTAV